MDNAKSWRPKSTDASEVKISDRMVGNGILSAGNRKGRPTIKQMPQLRYATWEK